LQTGSWIGASLDTWIGEPEHNVAWDLLAETRDWLDAQSQQRPKESQSAALAWREILITEGSDWFWWFSRKHDSGMDPIWDNQFRLHLRNVYKLMGARAPARPFHPIIKRAPTRERGVPALDGDSDMELPLPKTAIAELGFEPAYVVRITPRAQGGKVTVAKVVEPLTRATSETSWDVEDPFSVAVPFPQVGKRPGDAFEVALIVSREGRDMEVVPPSGALGLRVPGQAAQIEVPHSEHLKVLVATAELAPFAKLGGVSDVAA